MAHSRAGCRPSSRRHRSCARVILSACTLATFTLCALLLLRAPTQASVEAKSVYLLANLDDARLLQRSASYKWKRDSEPSTPPGPTTESKSDQASTGTLSEEEKSFAAEDGSGGGDSSPSDQSTSGGGGDDDDNSTGANQQGGAPLAEQSPRALGSPPPPPAVSGPLEPAVASKAEADAMDKFGDNEEAHEDSEEGEALSGGRQLTEVKAVGSSQPALVDPSTLAPSNSSSSSNVATEKGQSEPSPELSKLDPPTPPPVSGSLGKDQLAMGQMVTNITSAAQKTVEDIAKQMGLGGGNDDDDVKQEARPSEANPIAATIGNPVLAKTAEDQASKIQASQPSVAETKTAVKEEVITQEKLKVDDFSSKIAAPVEQKQAQQEVESKGSKVEGETVANRQVPETQKVATNDISAGSQAAVSQPPAQLVAEPTAKQVAAAQENIAATEVATTPEPVPVTPEPTPPSPELESEEKTEPTTPVVPSSSTPESEVNSPETEEAPVLSPPATATSGGEKPKEETGGKFVGGEEQYRQANPEPIEESEAEQSINYKLDHATCSAGAGGHHEPAVLERAVETILSALLSENCGQPRRNLKLKPLVNKRLAGFVLESSSLPLDPTQFTLAQMTRVSCATPATSNTTVRFKFEQDFADQYLASRWRLYPRLRQDDLPDEVFKSLAALKSHNHVHSGGGYDSRQRAGKSHGSNRCQRFGVESGDFYLELLSLKTSSIYEVELDESGQQEATSVQLLDFKVDQLYLDHGLVRLQDSGETQSSSPNPDLTLRRHSRQQTRQILHASNTHFRRNNWLLDLYGNWMRHEYRAQLRYLLSGPALRDQLNSCLADIHHPAAASAATTADDGQQTSGGDSPPPPPPEAT